MEKLIDNGVEETLNLRLDTRKILSRCSVTNYGKGSTGYQESRGKLFGAGYEIYIIAFFIGLYFDKRREMNLTLTSEKVLVINPILGKSGEPSW